MNATIDFEAIRSTADLRKTMEGDLGRSRGGRWACPLHDGSNPTALSIGPDGERWNCFSCGRGGDVLDWVVEYEGLTKSEAARKLLGEPSGAGKPKARPVARKA